MQYLNNFCVQSIVLPDSPRIQITYKDFRLKIVTFFDFQYPLYM
jgi:hypothetical protein